MRDYTVFSLSDLVIGRPPKRLGVNVEVQDHQEESNLYDWLADSGAQVIRSFHPERTLRCWSVA